MLNKEQLEKELEQAKQEENGLREEYDNICRIAAQARKDAEKKNNERYRVTQKVQKIQGKINHLGYCMERVSDGAGSWSWGTRYCSRKAVDGTDYCKQHGKMHNG